jgi:NAD(P)-dependent dehydrogenase (short-subunit alcohol dehydrogenase family)
MEETVRTYGRIDALVNNVGGFPRGTLEETTTEFWESVLSLNLRGAFYCCKYATPHLRAAGGGSIVNVGSIHGVQGAANLVAYSAAKGGLLTMTRTLAGALATDRIRVNYIIPGWVLTDTEIALQASQGRSLEELYRIGADMPLGRHQTPEDTAYAVVYLVSDESTQVTAALLNVDAGDSMLPNNY